MENTDESVSTTGKRFTYDVRTTYSVFAKDENEADAFFSIALEESIFNDSVNISKNSITRTEFIDNGEKEHVWSHDQKKWVATKYRLNS